MLALYRSCLLFIDYESQNTIWRIDLDDMRKDSLRLSVYISNVASFYKEPKGRRLEPVDPYKPEGNQNFVFCLSKIGDSISKVRIDISLLVPQTSVKITNCDDHKFSLLECSDKYVLAIGEKHISEEVHSNKMVLFDRDLKEIARRDIVLKSKAGWIEKALLCEINNRTFIALVAVEKFNFYLLEVSESAEGEELKDLSRGKLIENQSVYKTHKRKLDLLDSVHK